MMNMTNMSKYVYVIICLYDKYQTTNDSRIIGTRRRLGNVLQCTASSVRPLTALELGRKMKFTHAEMHGQDVRRACRTASHCYVSRLEVLPHRSPDSLAPATESVSNKASSMARTEN